MSALVTVIFFQERKKKLVYDKVIISSLNLTLELTRTTTLRCNRLSVFVLSSS
jgi:hypothetical protein